MLHFNLLAIDNFLLTCQNNLNNSNCKSLILIEKLLKLLFLFTDFAYLLSTTRLIFRLDKFKLTHLYKCPSMSMFLSKNRWSLEQ